MKRFLTLLLASVYLLVWLGTVACRTGSDEQTASAIEHQPSMHARSTMMLSASGQRLADFFDSLSPHPELTVDKLIEAEEKREERKRACTSTAASPIIERLLPFLEPDSVQAEITCNPNEACVSSYWVEGIDYCAGPFCSGTYDLPVYDPQNGKYWRGHKNAGVHGCDNRPSECPCDRELCDSAPPCEDECSEVGAVCAVGKKCSYLGCCDDSFTCPSPQFYCEYPVPNCGTGYYCDNGCCKQGCDSDDDCVPEYYCNLFVNECRPSNCTPPVQSCHGEGEGCGETSVCRSGCCLDESPIIIDLDANGYALTSAEDGVDFDMAGGSEPRGVAWTTAGSDDAFLALDRDGNGAIDDGTELFGNFTPQPENGAPNGFEALRVFDQPENGGNADGWIDNQDTVFGTLLLWRDANHNGVSEAGELSPLSQSVVAAISLDYQEHKWEDAFGNQFRYRAKTNRVGHPGGQDKWAYDVLLLVAP